MKLRGDVLREDPQRLLAELPAPGFQFPDCHLVERLLAWPERLLQRLAVRYRPARRLNGRAGGARSIALLSPTPFWHRPAERQFKVEFVVILVHARDRLVSDVAIMRPLRSSGKTGASKVVAT